MVVDYVIGFSQYLNDNGFIVTNDKISRFFYMMNDFEIDFTNQQDVLDLMKIVFCSNQLQVETLPKHFEYYIKHKQYLDELSKAEKEVNTSKQRLNDFTKSKEVEINELKAKIEQESNNIRKQNIKVDTLLKKTEQKFVENNLNAIKKNKMKNKEQNKFIKECIIKQSISSFSKFTSSFMKQMMNDILKKSEEALKNGNIDEFKILKEIFNILKRLSKIGNIEEKTLEEKINKATANYRRQLKGVEKELEKEKKRHQEIQNNLNQMINQSMKEVEKPTPKSHRDVFIGKNAVRIIGNNTLPNCMETNFNHLLKEDMNTIYYYIKKNILKFKTKMTRNINTQEKQRINIKTTIQNACKTRGLPINLCYKKSKPNKTKLVLVLDVSGSCKDASTMMLTFMHLLQSVFPRGCKTFAFVDSLYDISDIMYADNIDTSINDVLNVIPRRGVYSNYYEPLKTLWTDYKTEITSDSIVIFMGDARNNKNETGIEYIKNIARRAKKAYWLNTEEYNKWGKADSLAFEYARYFKMFEICNALSLVEFIQNI